MTCRPGSYEKDILKLGFEKVKGNGQVEIVGRFAGLSGHGQLPNLRGGATLNQLAPMEQRARAPSFHCHSTITKSFHK
jgi:hypothetical protein